MKLDSKSLKAHFDEDLGNTYKVSHVVVPLRGQFKGEQGKRCHLIPLASRMASGLSVRDGLKLFITTWSELGDTNPWGFINNDGSKMEFGTMNEIILTGIESVKEADLDDRLKLRDQKVHEESSINHSFRCGLSTHVQNCKVPESVINAQNRWRKIEQAQGK